MHERDEDCAGHIDPETDSCRVCGVDHGGECPECHGRGFHRAGCASPECETRFEDRVAS
jgi:hypothetical protein